MSSALMTEEQARSYLTYSLAVPGLWSTMWLLTPGTMYWRHTFFCSTFGALSWVALVILGTAGYMDPKRAILLILEFGFGMVTVIYMIVDCPLASTDLPEQLLMIRILASVPVVQMMKQLARTTVYFATNDVGPSWSILADMAELSVYFVTGFRQCSSFGDVWFLLYSGMPAALSSVLMHHLVIRLTSLNRAYTRLMQTTFAAVISVDNQTDGAVLAGSFGLDRLLGCSIEGLRLHELVTAKKEQLNYLLSPSKDGCSHVFRRLLTTLVSKDGSWCQDVELRSMAATEQETLEEKGIVRLGVIVGGERVPFQSHDATQSTLLEQSLLDLGNVRLISRSNDSEGTSLTSAKKGRPQGSVCSASVRSRARSLASEGGMRRRVPAQAYAQSVSISDTETSSCTLARGFHRNPAEKNIKTCLSDWGFSNNYTVQCSQAMLEDLILSWNFEGTGCCTWHAALDRLASLVTDMGPWHACDDDWPGIASNVSWQCNSCMALVREQLDASSCWLCCAPSSIEREAEQELSDDALES
eukprot:TRINITY_DN14136_c0_g1_i1.p1 TRINITY_DN14136_c0_g1~~TRINITY_DN14136_c0_g1_i1.p1  ORF type:complete len:528 (-),score=56.13 TRINITY_DN14136_c0_g1_i1:263-1846(-)